MVRHGITVWNEEGRIQGQTDTPLSDNGRKQCARWRLPDRYYAVPWFTSTLARTQQTAQLMGQEHFQACTELQEMDWGHWAGQTIPEMRLSLGGEMEKNESRGLDFRPTGGESPRMVKNRLRNWLNLNDDQSSTMVIVAHKGVIRAAISLATGWDMQQDFSEKLQRTVYHRFTLHDAMLELDFLNRPMLTRSDQDPVDRQNPHPA